MMGVCRLGGIPAFAEAASIPTPKTTRAALAIREFLFLFMIQTPFLCLGMKYRVFIYTRSLEFYQTAGLENSFFLRQRSGNFQSVFLGRSARGGPVHTHAIQCLFRPGFGSIAAAVVFIPVADISCRIRTEGKNTSRPFKRSHDSSDPVGGRREIILDDEHAVVRHDLVVRGS